ncbi:uncharacterized protein H6S33_010536 [Morchella sextelata]|uniref:uncharacterized protein n=1 Tax=Morchella sextelata TaxID=1174677 RepID=UPI001D0455C6|nr:uncharacterized protein H6S33_010536 [Morchella sextelata]KAH0611271.1 hypothetical protein H6S33_010536 [Morchella sextelata]
MAPTKRSSGSASLAPKRPRLPRRPEEHEDLLTDESEIPCRPLTPLPARTRSSQSTTAPIARKGLLCSTDTSTGRSSPRRVEFHLPDGNTDSVEVQEHQEDVPEVEETADTSHSEYDDSPENAQESSEENLDDPEESEEPQASTQQRSQSTGKRPRTVQPTTARALGNARRRPTGAVAEVIASSDVSVDVVQRGARLGAKVVRRAAPTSAPSQNASQRAPPIPTQSRPSEPVYYHDYSSSTRHIDLSSLRSRYGESSPTYRPYRSSPPFEGVGESSMSSPRIPSSPQVYLPEAQPRVYDIAQLSSSIREGNAPIAESEVSSIPDSTDDRFESTVNIHASNLSQRSLLPSSRSANILSMQAQRIEKECSTLIGDHTLLHEPFPPAARLTVLVVNMWAAASRRVGCAVDLDEVVIKQVRSLHSRVRSHLMHEVKGRLADSTIYGLGKLSSPEARAAQVEYLLKNDRFLSPAQHYETYRLRFLAPEIIDILYYKYFDGVRIRGVKDPEFLERITPTFICLISTAIWHGIRAWSTGTYVKPDHFQSQNESVVKTFNRMSNTWKGRSRQNQEATLEVIKDNLREKIREKKGITIEVIPEDGFSEDDEALAADLAAFRNARRAPPSAPGDISDNGGGQEEVVQAQLRGIEAEEEGEEDEDEDREGGEEEKDL